MKNLITCLVVCVLTSVAFAVNGTPDRGDCSSPPTPTGLDASSDICHLINITWDPVDDTEGYSIYRSLNSDSPAGLIGFAATASYVDFSVVCNTGLNYFYWVTAMSKGCESNLSDFAMGSCLPCNTWIVDDDGIDDPNADFDKIQDAVDAASDGDEIVVMPGTYFFTNANLEVIDTLGKEVWLHSFSGPAVTILDGELARRGILCNSEETPDTIIEGFTIKSGWGYGKITGGGGIYISESSTPTIRNCILIENQAYEGGGIHNVGNSSISDCIFKDNNAFHGGGILNLNSSSLISNCIFMNNSCSGPEGGGILNKGDGSPKLSSVVACGNFPDQISGEWTDAGGNVFYEECFECPDINGDENVNVIDLLIIINLWGLTSPPADVNLDGIVDVVDLLIVIDNWGACE